MLLENLLAYRGHVWLITVTAPGVDYLPWACLHDGCPGARIRAKGGCGTCGCKRAEQHAAHDWNKSAQRRWSELHREAHQQTTRALGLGSLRSLARVWQMQSRGVLHLHLAVGVESEGEYAAARFYVAELRRLAGEHHFGFIDARDRDGKAGKSMVLRPERAAGYMARYLGESSQLVEAVALEDRPRRLVWISPTLTATTGCTITRLRRARYLYWIRKGRSVYAMAGRLPAWFRDAVELPRVQLLLRESLVPAAP